jgi:hypothetical protein
MQMRVRTSWWVLVGALALLLTLLGAIILPSAWLRQGEDKIRLSLLRSTPLGTTTSNVQHFIDSRRWPSYLGKKDSGSFELYLREPHPEAATAIEVDLGRYQGWPWSVKVEGLWIFDAEAKLIELQVSKIYDSP